MTTTATESIINVLNRNSKRGLTDEEIVNKTGVPYESASRRRRELVEDGLVVNSGRTRTVSSGVQASVWVPAA